MTAEAKTNLPPSFEDRLRAYFGVAEIDLQFARFFNALCGLRDADVFLAVCLTSHAVGEGSVCLDLNKTVESFPPEHPAGTVLPPPDTWVRKLRACPAIGEPGQKRPLILDRHRRLYLYRYWEYEHRLAEHLRQRLSSAGALDTGRLKALLNGLFPEPAQDGVQWQKTAAALAVLRRICIITGGPGTGKSFTIAAILATLLEYYHPDALRIFLAAPTGKAAARLGESLRSAKEHLNCSAAVRSAVPESVSTIHRLLRPIPHSPYFFYRGENPLPADVVVVDEASMVDLALMSKLLEAVPAESRLILAGDMDQLASVEAGSVLGDICDRGDSHPFSHATCRRIEETAGQRPACGDEEAPEGGMQDCIVVLRESFRFDSGSAIARLGRAVKDGRWDDCERLLLDPEQSSVEWYAATTVERELRERIVGGYRGFLELGNPHRALSAFRDFQILCALKIGPFGAAAINRLSERALHDSGILQMDRRRDDPWYPGRPVLVTRNDSQLGLFNGDTGIAMPDPEGAEKRIVVFFEGPGGELRRFLPHRLPQHETAFAMTVHKSQGSEFNEVLLILPDRDYPVLSRELLYTALTRARFAVTIWGPKAVLAASVRRRIQRSSGLREALWDRKSD
jgi:exodeoxyribonuclease V alpha subunit